MRRFPRAPSRPLRRLRARLFRLGLAMVLGLVALAACGESSKNAAPGVETINVWAMGREAEILPELIKPFEAENPRLKVRVQQIPWTAAHEKLLTSFVGDSLPDLAQMGNTWIPEFAALGALSPLDEAVRISPNVKRADYFDGVWDTNIVDDQLWGLPWYVDTRLLFYRRDLLAQAGFQKPPRDWGEWHRAAAAIKGRSGAEHFGILLPLNEFEPQVMLALQQPDSILRDGDRFGNFSAPSQVKAIDFYLSFFRDQLAPAASENQIANVWDEFGRGYFAFYITGPWNIGEFKRRLPPERQQDWMTAPLPGPGGPGASIAGGASFVVFKHSKRKAAALRLIDYLERPAVEARFYALSGNLPPRRSAWADPALAADPYVAAFRDQLERARPAPKIPEWERIAQEIRTVTERAARENWRAEDAARELDRRTDAILAKRRSVLARRERRGA